MRAAPARAAPVIDPDRIAILPFRARIVGLVGVEHLVLARAWESRGDYRRAASAARLILEGQGAPSIARATGARMEGRLSLLAGDTTGAIAAYQRYLDLRRDAEPVLIPQRDSVRAELAKLVRPRS
jgi:hypothetical protein